MPATIEDPAVLEDFRKLLAEMGMEPSEAAQA
jgi:hypothetical protein